MHRILIFLFLMTIWLVFSGLFDMFHITLGVLSCAFITYISCDLFFPNQAETLGTRARQAYRLICYLLWLLWQIVLSNIHLLKLTLAPGGMKEICPSIVKFKTPLKSDFEKFMLANSITLTPGTTTLRIEGDTFYIHAISKTTAAGLDGEMDRRIAHIFADPGKEQESTKEEGES